MNTRAKGASAPSKFVSEIFARETPEGLTLKESSWENEYRGTESAFIEAGFIKPEWLPGKPGNAKTKVKVGIIDGEMRVIAAHSSPTDDQWENGFICITKSPKGQLTVSVNCLPEELEKREAAEFAKSKQARVKEALAEIEKNISSLPANGQAFIERTEHIVRCFSSIILNGLVDGCGHSGGYRFSSDVIEAFEGWATHATKLIQEAQIYFDPDIRQNEIASIKGTVLTKYGLFSDDEEIGKS